MILKLTREINREVWSNVRSWKFVRMCMCDVGIVEQYKACCPCHFHYRQLCYPCHFIFSFELDMSVLSTSFKFDRLTSILLSFFVCHGLYISRLYVYTPHRPSIIFAFGVIHSHQCPAISSVSPPTDDCIISHVGGKGDRDSAKMVKRGETDVQF